MLEKILTIQYMNVRNNFCILSPNVIKELGSNTYFKLTNGEDRAYFFSVCPQIQNIGDNYLGINSLYAKLLKIEENSTVVLSIIESIPKVKSFTIYPLRFDDFHILDLLKNEVENCILNQTSIVGENQEMLIWIGENLNIPVKVVSVEPRSPGKLENSTELIILPEMKKISEGETKNIEENKLVPDVVNGGIPIKTLNVDMFNFTEELTENERKTENKIKTYFSKREYYKGRLVPYPHLEFFQHSVCSYEFNVIICRKSAPLTWRKCDSFHEPIFGSLSVIHGPNPRNAFVRVFIIEEIAGTIAINNIFIHKNLFKIMNCELGTGVMLKPLARRDTTDEIEVHTEYDKREVKTKLQDFLAVTCKDHAFVLNADTPLKLENDIHCILKFKPHYAKYCCIDQEFLRNCSYSFINDSIRTLPAGDNCEDNYFIETSSNNCICNDIMESIKSNLAQNDRLGCYLISGNIGSGKSKIIEHIKNRLYEHPCFIYSEVVQSKSSKGKTIDSIHKILATILENLVAHEPAMLFIDDLHILCKNVEDTDTQLQNALYYNRISEMMYSLLMTVTENCSVGIIATVESFDKVNSNIYNSRGTYLFEKQYHIGELSKDDRVEIIKHFVKDYHCEVNLDVLAQKCEGYVFQDLYDLIQKSIFQSVKHDDNIIGEEHVAKALSQMVILSHSDIKLHSPGDKDFSNIGGLSDVKELMGESLMWPLKYHTLFENAPLRLQSGLLLYGPPGTGKTLLAGAVAKEYGVRLISIKGPELLSKYIGASEQTVRDVFLQAQSAKPCILFFDEFDSLAPRRGHDSTGVTDRVVNQLLTQMDGVESLAGVFVIAATSRPDLLDPALLRPGRLDKQIYCPFPDMVSRLDILKVLSKSLNLSDDVNLDEIAYNTDGFSGADLQSLLYNAQLSTMEHLLVSENNKDVEQLRSITQEILDKSLDNTRPSLNAEERKKYNLIYSKFRGKSDVDYSKLGSKASLA